MRVNLEARRKFMMMYSLSNDNCTSTFININPISYPSNQQVFPHKTFPTIDTCFSLFHPPSPLIEPFEDEVDLLFPYLQNLETTQQPYFSNEDFNVPIISTQVMNMDDDLSKKSDGKCNKKKCYKKDRHSKIVTSKGPRDRRMRLSLEVAPRFFNLQEMLGFDKASKTLEWLMNKSHLAIMELSRNTNSSVTGDPQPVLNTCLDAYGALVSSTTSECEAISSSSNVVEDLEGLENLKGKKNSSSCNKKFNKKIEKTSRRIRPFSKKTREEARERARKRTLKKKQEKYNNEEVFLF